MVEVFELSDLRKNDNTLQEEGRKSESSVMDEILKYFQQQTTPAKPQVCVNLVVHENYPYISQSIVLFCYKKFVFFPRHLWLNMMKRIAHSQGLETMHL